MCILIHIRTKGEIGTVNMFKPSSKFLSDRSKAVLFVELLFLVICVSFLSLSFCFVCSLQHYDHLLGKGSPLVALVLWRKATNILPHMGTISNTVTNMTSRITCVPTMFINTLATP